MQTRADHQQSLQDRDSVTLGLVLGGCEGLVEAAASSSPPVDSRLRTLHGQPLIARAIDYLRSRFPRVDVVVPSGQPLDLGDAAPYVTVLHEATDASALAGLAAGLRATREPVCAVGSTLPLPPGPEALDRLMAAWDGRADACLPAVAGLPLPLFGLYHPRCLPVLERALAVGERHLSETLTRLIVHSVPFADATPFAPIATADEYARVQRLLAPPPQPFPGPATSGTQPALLAIVGKSDAGKTTVVERLLPELQRLGLRVGTVKHDAHDFQIDHPGTDSYRHGAAGAPAYTVASPHRLAFVTLLDEDLPLVEIARRFYPGFDLVLAEGYKRLAPYRVEIYRRAAGHPEPLCASEEMLAVLSDAEVPHPKRFVLDDIAGLAAFIVMRLGSLRQY